MNPPLSTSSSEMSDKSTEEELDTLDQVYRPKNYSNRQGMQRVLRWPIFAVICAVLLVEAICYLLIRSMLAVYELGIYLCNFVVCGKKVRALQVELKNATSFEEWHEAACGLDVLEKRNEWKTINESPYYDYENVEQSLSKMRFFAASSDYNNLMNILSDIYTRNVAHNTIDNEQLYNQTHFGTKHLVSDFISEVISSTKIILNSKLDKDIKLSFFKRSKRAYGRTALCLSGGATMSYFHFGVIKALVEARCLPSIMSGCSGGAMVGGWIGVRTEKEILELIKPELHVKLRPCNDSWVVRLKRLYNTGALFDWNIWIEMTKEACLGDTTFEEAYQKTGRILNISVTATHKHSAPIVLNYVTAPNIVIWSAVLASSAIPMIINPVQLYRKLPNSRIEFLILSFYLSDNLVPYLNFGNSFADGTIKNDLPMKQLSESFNVNFFIVSQTNPHIIPLAFSLRAESGKPGQTRRSGSEFRGGFIFSAIEIAFRLEMRKWLQVLSELDLLPDFFNQDWRKIFLQATSGDVTILANPRFRDYLRLIEDPTFDDMKYYIEEGQRTAWPRLCMLSNHYIFEKCLDECLKEIEGERANAMGVPMTIRKCTTVQSPGVNFN